EQHYLNSILPGYNILPTAGSLLGFYHSSETKAKMSEAKKGITRSEEMKALLSEANIGKTLSADTNTKISETKKGKTLSAETKAKMSEAKKGKILSAETRAKSSATKGTAVLVYSEDNILINTFFSAREAGKYYNCSHSTITAYLKSKKLFLDK